MTEIWAVGVIFLNSILPYVSFWIPLWAGLLDLEPKQEMLIWLDKLHK